MNAKKWNCFVVGGCVCLMLLLAGATIIIDPFLHFHGGLSFLQYPLNNERYQNDGISRHYDYDSIVAGTSMSENFKTSEFDQLWGGTSIKICNSGATFYETSQTIRRALSYQPNVKTVLCSFDWMSLNYSAMEYTYTNYPDYLYDDNPFNDVSYFLNKEVLPSTVAVVNYTRAGNKTTTMDQYMEWGSYKEYGKDVVLEKYHLAEIATEVAELSDEDRKKISENVTENFVKLAQSHPDVTFLLFFPPYNICFWESLVRGGQMEAQEEILKMATELLLEVDNIEIYDFSYRVDIVNNFDNYTDTLHYGPWISTEILQMIHNKEGLLTRENYLQYWEETFELYQEFDYSEYKK